MGAEMRKKKCVATGFYVLLVAVLTVALASQSFGGVQNTLHDLSIANPKTQYRHDTDQVCIFCHTPHNASGSVSLLWNRTVRGANYYLMYTNTTKATTRLIARDLSAESVMCMSCHDGGLALGQVLNTEDNGPAYQTSSGDAFVVNRIDSPGPKIGDSIASGGGLSGVTNDLEDDHPVSMQMDPGVPGIKGVLGGSPGFYVQNTVPAPGLPLYGASGTVECATCHDVHNDSNAFFLRFTNDGSQLCLNCHDK